MGNLLEVRELCHSYGSHQVLKNLSFSLEEGEILGIIGENGAGKSTLVKCILGLIKPTAGEIVLKAVPSAIHQDLNIVDELDVSANFFLGREITNKFGFLDTETMAKRVQRGLARLGVELDPFALASSLSVSEKQMVEIARALDIDADILILDEPSALLNNEETSRLFSIMRKLKRAKTSMIYISHKLDEIKDICDKVAVLRDGELVDAQETSMVDTRQMAEMMVGRPLEDIYPGKSEPKEVSALSFSAPEMGAFTMRAGEILGVAGLADSGQNELCHALTGFSPIEGQKVVLFGEEVAIDSPQKARKLGINILTADRLSLGLWRDFSISENIALGAVERFASKGFLNKSEIEKETGRYIDEFHIRCRGTDSLISELSGGNQQKVSMGKVLADDPKIVILNEPTQGVDVGARQEIYSVISKLARDGLSILLVSSDMNELIGLGGRVLVMREGRIAGEVAGEEVNEKSIIHLAMGTEACPHIFLNQ